MHSFFVVPPLGLLAARLLRLEAPGASHHHIPRYSFSATMGKPMTSAFPALSGGEGEGTSWRRADRPSPGESNKGRWPRDRHLTRIARPTPGLDRVYDRNSSGSVCSWWSCRVFADAAMCFFENGGGLGGVLSQDGCRYDIVRLVSIQWGTDK